MDTYTIIIMALILGFGYFIYNVIACHMKKQDYSELDDEEVNHI